MLSSQLLLLHLHQDKQSTQSRLFCVCVLFLHSSSLQLGQSLKLYKTVVWMGTDMPWMDYLPTNYWSKKSLRLSQAIEAKALGNTLLETLTL